MNEKLHYVIILLLHIYFDDVTYRLTTKTIHSLHHHKHVHRLYSLKDAKLLKYPKFEISQYICVGTLGKRELRNAKARRDLGFTKGCINIKGVKLSLIS